MAQIDSRAVLLHLRFPFSLLLLPVFLMGLLFWPEAELHAQQQTVLLAFLSLHLFIYPASNGYNSFQDRDTDSIGMLKNPPPVNHYLYYACNIMDVIGLALAFWASTLFGILLCGYILCSRAYSWRGLRLKRYPWTGFMVVFIFQGAVVFLATATAWIPQVFSALDRFPELGAAAISASLLFGGSYPVTQIYQHESDKASGVRTASMALGIPGTFAFSGLLFGLGLVLFCFSYAQHSGNGIAPWHFIFLVPGIFIFGRWAFKSMKDPAHANYRNTMRLITLSALGFNLFFLSLFLSK